MNMIRAFGRLRVMNAENIGNHISFNGSIVQNIQSNTGLNKMCLCAVNHVASLLIFQKYQD